MRSDNHINHINVGTMTDSHLSHGRVNTRWWEYTRDIPPSPGHSHRQESSCSLLGMRHPIGVPRGARHSLSTPSASDPVRHYPSLSSFRVAKNMCCLPPKPSPKVTGHGNQSIFATSYPNLDPYLSHSDSPSNCDSPRKKGANLSDHHLHHFKIGPGSIVCLIRGPSLGSMPIL